MQAIVDKKGKPLALILQTMDYMMGTDKRFFNNSDEVLQIGALFFEKGSEVKPHIHKTKESSNLPMECILVLAGEADAEIYDDDKRFIELVHLVVGDILIQKRGGHGFRFPNDARFLEIKRGPYHSKESDKEMI